MVLGTVTMYCIVFYQSHKLDSFVKRTPLSPVLIGNCEPGHVPPSLYWLPITPGDRIRSLKS